MNTSEVLNRAADLIEERGWAPCGDWGHQSTGPLCAEGAIRHAVDRSNTRFYEVRRVVEAHIGLPRKVTFRNRPELPGWFTPYLWVWNDTEPVNAAEVIEVLRACAVIEAAREEQDAAWATYAELVTA